jgi:hypothetical protein
MSGPIVIILTGEDGFQTAHYTEGVTVYSIDERSKSDRVYQMTTGLCSPDQIKALLGDSEVGRFGDRPAAEQAIRAALAQHNGERLKLVTKDNPGEQL